MVGIAFLDSVSCRIMLFWNGKLKFCGLLTGKSKDKESQNKIVADLQGVSTVSSKLLLAAKLFSSDPNAPGAKGHLQDAAR